MSTDSAFTAHNGFTLPPIGLGTYKLRGEAGAESVRHAIELGYRLIDTAVNYENEGAVGWGVAGSAADPKSLIVTTKLAGRHHAREAAETAIEESRFRLGVDAIGLLLIHWPNPSVNRYVDAWRALIDAKERGLVRQIGVSNFLPEHLERLERDTGIRPVVNQIELHPYFPQTDALAYNREKGIITQAWSPLGRAQALLQETTIQQVAADHSITAAQAILAWHATRGSVAIPKASSEAHQSANLAACNIVLSGAEVESITALGRANGRLFGADPATHEED